MRDGAIHPQAHAAPSGVLERHGDATHTRLRVTSGESDWILVTLVHDGWHIEAVSAAVGEDAVHVEARRPAAG
jgi:hypothetical protein